MKIVTRTNLPFLETWPPNKLRKFSRDINQFNSPSTLAQNLHSSAFAQILLCFPNSLNYLFSHILRQLIRKFPFCHILISKLNIQLSFQPLMHAYYFLMRNLIFHNKAAEYSFYSKWMKYLLQNVRMIYKILSEVKHKLVNLQTLDK